MNFMSFWLKRRRVQNARKQLLGLKRERFPGGLSTPQFSRGEVTRKATSPRWG